MIPHPSAWLDNPETRTTLSVKENTMWKSWLKTLGTWIVKLGPGLVESILAAKAKKDAEQPKA
jgi:hypothetical protein